MKLLFVCTGNTCRSVLAEQWAKKLARDRGLDWQARSAGVAADPFAAVPEEVRQALREAGADGDFKHEPARLDAAAVDWADLILAMEEIHAAVIASTYPQARAKTDLLRRFVKLTPEEVRDPIGAPLETYRASLASIREAIDEIADSQPPKK